jgi:hypothetical protein
VIVLIALTIGLPRQSEWTLGNPLKQHLRSVGAMVVLRNLISRDPMNGDAKPHASFPAPLPRPVIAPLEPPVAQRFAVDGDPGFMDHRDAGSPSLFPDDVDSADELSTAEVSRERQESSIGPVLPPGIESMDSLASPLELVRPDLDPFASPREPFKNSVPAPSLELPDGLKWPTPVALTMLLDQLPADSAQLAAWNSDVRKRFESLQSLHTLADPAAGQTLQELKLLASRAPILEAYLAPDDRIIMRRIRYGIARRVEIWQSAGQLAAEQQAAPLLVHVNDALPVIQEVDRRIAQHPHADAWRRWLTLDKLTQIATETWISDATVRRDAARTVLLRLQSDRLTSEQRAFLQDPAIHDLQRQLNDWADQPVDVRNLLQTLEQFEQIRTARLAEQVVDQLASLEFCRRPAAMQLASRIDTHYRNANVRIEISGQLMNDLMPVLEPMQQQIRDTILGASVVGQNRTWTDLGLQLIDDPNQLRIRIQADGRSRSTTVSQKGPVRFFSRDRSEFQAGKDLLVSADGVYVTRATATAEGQTRLINIETDYDDIPLLGWIVKQIALDEHHEQRFRLRREVKQRLSSRVSKQLDSSIHDRLEGAEAKIDQQVIKPLRELNLDPRAIEMRTQDDNLVMRFRLAADDQLAAYTPRPRPDASSVLSLQLHESGANNLLQQLKLEDQRIELEQLMEQLAQKLHIDRQDIHEELPEGVTIRMAKERPVHFEFDEDRVVVEVRIQELTTPRRTWKNFAARGRYRADMGQTHLDLERDGGIELISTQIGFRDQVALRGIFTKVLARNHRLNVLHGKIKNNAQLNNLGITQFVSRDGWIGISLGPMVDDRIANRPSPLSETPAAPATHTNPQR